MGFFETILDGFFAIIGAIAAAIRRVFIIVGDIITWFGTEVLPWIAAAFSAVVLTVAAVAIFAPAVAVAIVDFLVYGQLVIGSINLGFASTVPITINLSAKVLVSLVATFLEAIHFDTLLQLHNIAWVLSEDYRKVVGKLFKKMSEISEELFGWSLGLRVILENSRSIILTSSAALGYSYDVSQLVWLNGMTDFFVVFNDHAERYMDDPELLFFDLEEWIDKNAIDVSAGAHGVMFNSVRSLTLGLENTAKNVYRIDGMAHENESAVNRLTAGHYGERIDFNFNLFRDFKGDDYAPTQERQEKSINMNRQETAENRKTLSDLNWKLKRPTGQLDGIEDLPEPQKSEEEINLQELSTRPFQEESNILESEQAAADANKEKEQAEQEKEMAEKVAPETITTRPITKAEFKPQPPVNSWFVGDY